MFLKDLLEPAISLPDAFELDDKRIRHASLASGNAKNIENVCDQIVAAFTNLPATLCPPLILHLNKFLREQDHSANSNNALLLIVLRILTPAVISPEKYGLYDGALLPNQRRALLMIAKTLQQISNGIVAD